MKKNIIIILIIVILVSIYYFSPLPKPYPKFKEIDANNVYIYKCNGKSVEWYFGRYTQDVCYGRVTREKTGVAY